jgi:hypothetical protein
MRRPFLLLSLLAAGCSDGASGPAVGSWQHYDPRDGSADYVLTLAGDGDWESVAVDGDTSSGTWEVDGDELTVSWTGDDGLSSRSATYHADDDVLLLLALVPDGEVDGLVGRWRGHEHLAPAGTGTVDITQLLVVNADGTASFDQTGEGDSELEDHWTGTWTEADGRIDFEYVSQESGFELRASYRAVPGFGLSDEPDWSFTRLE